DEAGEPAALGLELGHLTGVDRLQVGAGGEDRTGVSDDSDPRFVVLFETIDRGLHPLRDIAVDGVAGFWTVERDDQHPPLELVVDHGVTLWGRSLSEETDRGARWSKSSP